MSSSVKTDSQGLTAEDHKNKGNSALQANQISQAIEHYTAAINLDGANVVYFSNRSAAYLKKNDAVNALADAESCIALDPTFSKGFSRKGAALHAAKRYNDSIAAYQQGLAKFSNDAALQNGLASVQRDQKSSNAPPAASPSPFANLFGPDLMTKIALNPKLRPYLNDADFVQKVKILQTNPNSMETMIQDKRIMEVFQHIVLGGMGMPDMDGSDDNEPNDTYTRRAPPATTSTTPGAATKKSEAPEPMEEDEEDEIEEVFSDALTPEQIKLAQEKKDKKAAVEAKERGNKLYQAKDFDGALTAYEEAFQLDSTNMTFLSNKAAVHFTQNSFDECIRMCDAAMEVAVSNKAPFEDRAKALTRCGKAYQKKGDYATAIEKLKAAQFEHQNKETQRLLKTWELEKKKKDALSYQDDALADEHKQKGNDHFRAKEWGEAVKEYEEAVKRAPKNAAIRNNLSAALCKIMDFNGAKREVEIALDLDSKYVKAWARKGDIEILLKENHKAMESFRKGLEIDPESQVCMDGLRKVSTMINHGSANMSEDERKERAAHAMADPDIQNILMDPIIQQVLQDFQHNPKAANEAMKDQTVRKKIEKLIASGVVQTA
jgi:stress-induced-phosphoprotein 1